MKLLRSSPHSRPFCLPLACLLALSACAPGTVGADAEPAPIEVPPPVEQTNEGLTIFYTDYDESTAKILDAAVTQYNTLHPDQPVTVEKIYTDRLIESYNAAYDQMLTEIMAGEGPDLIFYDNVAGVESDWEKLARRGAFADLEPYFTADSFDWSGYSQAVVDGGVYDGHRLFVPLIYQLPMLYTSQGALDETGFDVENCGTFNGFMDEVEKMMADPTQTRSVFRHKFLMVDFPQYAGIPYVDYDRQRADLSFPELERGMKFYKEFVPIAPGASDRADGAADVRDGKALWLQPYGAVMGFLWGPGAINTFDDLVMMPIRDLDGGIRAGITWAVAANSASPNLQNAYEFIKFLLSEEFQTSTASYWLNGLSVLDAGVMGSYQYIVQTAEDGKIPVGGDATYGFTYLDISQEDFEKMLSYADQVTGIFFNTAQTRITLQIPDYFAGEASYKQAIGALESQLNIYLSE